MFLFSMKKKHNLAALCGFGSLLIRQTNIVWVIMVFGINSVNKLIIKTLPKIKDQKHRCINPSFTSDYSFKVHIKYLLIQRLSSL